MAENLKISEDKPTKFTLVFNDGKKFLITEQFYKLCPFMQDLSKTFVSDEPVEVPFENHDSKCFEIIYNLFNLIKTQDRKAYFMALKSEKFEIEPSALLKSFFDGLDDTDRVDATNFCDGYLSMDFIKRYFVLYYALRVKSSSPDDIQKLGIMLGSLVLDKSDLELHELQEEKYLWKIYGKLFESIMDQAFDV